MPNLKLWLLQSFVRLPTACHCFSSWSSGQLHRFTPRPDPASNALGDELPSPLMNNAGSPDVNVVSMFSPGMPASAAGVVPKSNGSTLTLYSNQPNRKSASSVDESVLSTPSARLWFFTSETPPRLTSSAPPPCPNAVGPLRENLPQL